MDQVPENNIVYVLVAALVAAMASIAGLVKKIVQSNKIDPDCAKISKDFERMEKTFEKLEGRVTESLKEINGRVRANELKLARLTNKDTST